MKTTPVNSPDGPKTSGGYSQACMLEDATRLLFISGQIPETGDGEVPAGFAAQAELVWKNVIAQLKAAGMDIENLVKVTTLLSSREYAAANRDARNQALGKHSPALTVVIAGIFDEQWLLEIEAVAAA